MLGNCNCYELDSISKSYLDNKGQTVHALSNITLTLPCQGFIGITGQSGSGKSTLLNILGLIEKPTTGMLAYNGRTLDLENQNETGKIRSTKIGFVFQEYNLLHDLSVHDNLSIGIDVTENDVLDILDMVKMNHVIHSSVKYLSGGEKQRLAIARALIRNSEVFLLDEPTGNLDSYNSDMIFSLLRDIAKNRLVVVVSHDRKRLSRFSDELYYLDSGKIINRHTCQRYNEFIIESSDGLSDAIHKMTHQSIKLRDIRLIEIENLSNGKTDRFDSEDYLLNDFVNMIKDKGESRLVVKAYRQHSFSSSNDIFTHKASHSDKLTLNFKLKYAARLLIKKRFLSFLTIVSLFITFLLVIMQVSITYINPESILKNAIAIENTNILPIRKNITNEHTLVNNQYTGGKYLFDYYRNMFGDHRIYSFMKLSIASESSPLDLEQYTNHIDMNTVINYQPSSNLLMNEEIHGVHPDVEGTIVITDFLAEYVFGHKHVIGYTLNLYSDDSIFQSDVANDQYLTICGVIQTDYEKRNLFHSIAYDANYLYENSSSIHFKYALSYMSQETYESLFDRVPVYLKAADFTLTTQNTSTYVRESAEITFKQYNQEFLSLGRKPEKTHEILVSSDFFSSRNMSFQTTDLNSIYHYKDLMNSINWSYYQDLFNIYDIVNSVEVVGVVEGPPNTIYVYEDLHQAIVREYIAYVPQIGISADTNTQYETIEALYNDDTGIDLDYLIPIYSYILLVTSLFSRILFVLLILFVAIASILTLINSLICIREKTKEIGIMKSLGIRIPQIFVIFMIQSAIPVLIAFIAASFMSLLGSRFINSIITSPDLFGTPHQLIFLSSYSYLVLLGVSTLMVITGTVIPFFKISKIDTSIVIENEN